MNSCRFRSPHLLFRTLILILTLLTLPLFAKGKIEKKLLQATPFSLAKEELITYSSPDKPAGLDVEVLLQKNHYRIDAEGKITKRIHSIYRILTQDGVNNWAYTSSSYSPWFQNKPKIQARVLTQEGVEQYLDTNTFVIQSAQTSSNSYTDRHTLQAPLPNIRIGAVVEEVITVSDHKPFFAAGRNFAAILYAYNYTWLKRTSIEYPSTKKLMITFQNSDLKQKKASTDSSTVVYVDQKNLKPFYYFPATTLPDIAITPILRFSSAKSWKSVSKTYSGEIENLLKTTSFSSIVDSLLQGETDSLAMIKKLNAFLHKEVRYTAYELGDKSIIPVSPAETLNKKYGDCKDKATLLVSLLREAGFTAHVALLSTGPGLDIDPKLPGIDQFDHAIVHVDFQNKPLWIDATAEYTQVGSLPMADQNRYILIASDTTEKLSHTPKESALMNGFDEVVSIQFRDDSSAYVEEITTGQGTIGANLRYNYDTPKEQFVKNAVSYCSDRYGGKPVEADYESMKDLTVPLKLSMSVNDAQLYTSYDEGATITLSPYGLFQYFPDQLLEEKADLDSIKKEEKRYSFPGEYPLYVSTQHKNSTTYKLKAPEGYEWKSTPEPIEIKEFGLKLIRKAKLIEKDSMEVTFSVGINVPHIDTADLDTVRAIISNYYQQAKEDLNYVHIAEDLIGQGKIKEGLAFHREILGKKKSVTNLIRYSNALCDLGFSKEARRIAGEALAFDSLSARANFAYGMYFLYDDFGNYLPKSADRKKAIHYYERSIELDTNATNYYNQLAELYLYNDKFIRLGKGSQLDKAEALIKVIKERFEDNTMDIDLFRIYLWTGRYDDAEKLAKLMPAEETKDKLWITLRFLQHGSQAALQKAKELSPTNYNYYLGQAASVLGALEKYKEAYQLLSETNCMGSSAIPYVELFKVVAQKDEILSTLTPLEKQISDDLHALISQSMTSEEFLTKLEKESKGKYYHKENLKAFAEEVGLFNKLDVSTKYFADLMICQFRYKITEEGNAVKTDIFLSNTTKELATLYFEKNRNKYRLVNATSDESRVSFFSAMSLYCIKNRKLKDALTWTNWGFDIISKYTDYNDEYQFSNAIKELMPKEMDESNKEKLSFAAATLSYISDDIPEAKDIILKTPESHFNSDSRKFALNWYKTMIAYYDAPESTCTQLEELIKTYPKDKALYNKYLLSLFEAKEYEKLYEKSKAYAQQFDDSLYSIKLCNQAKVLENKFPELLKSVQGKMADKSAYASELNGVAWFALFQESDSLTSAIELCEAAIKMVPKNMRYQHTLATLYVKDKQVNKATDYLKNILAYTTEKNVNSYDWYLIGNVAKELGLNTYSEYALNQVTKTEDSDYQFSAWHLLNKEK